LRKTAGLQFVRRDFERAGLLGEIDTDRAQALAKRLHEGQRDADGAPLIDHVQRVAAAVGPDARVVAWLDEVLERTSVSEQALLEEGVSTAQLRALRLLTRDRESRSKASYLGHIELIAEARGDGAGIAREVKQADLEDRVRNRRTQTRGWAPPYQLALDVLRRTRRRRDDGPVRDLQSAST
jgi:hypothetical protein